MNEPLPRRLLVIGALVLLLTPCALLTLAGLLPEGISGEDLVAVLLPVIIVAQVMFLYWYYRRTN